MVLVPCLKIELAFLSWTTACGLQRDPTGDDLGAFRNLGGPSCGPNSTSRAKEFSLLLMKPETCGRRP